MHDSSTITLSSPREEQTSKPKNKNDYAELKTLIRQAGLLERQPRYYVLKLISTLAMLAVGIAALVISDNPFVRALDAVYLAFVFTQLAFLGHDTGHKQIFSNTRANTIFGLFVGNLLIGMSVGWWVEKHNAHHAKPNHLDADPDLDIPLMAFSEMEARGRKGFARTVVKYQAFLFFPFLMLAAIDFHIQSVLYQFRRTVQYRPGETGLLAVHMLLYLGGLMWLLGPIWGTAFIALHQAGLGFFLGSVFAPNHKGMLIIDHESKLDFLRAQVLTARNVRPSPLVDFWYGGLNYQIEHHLFPSMPRNKLRDAQEMTRRFCEERGISYHVTGVRQSFREILQSLHAVAAPLRVEPRAHG